MQEEDLKNATDKINFLTRYGPMHRHMKPEALHEKEVFWEKELVTKGFPILAQGAPNVYVYILLKGRVTVLYDTWLLDQSKRSENHNQRWLKIQKIS